MVDIICEKLPKTDYPKTMFDTVQPDKLNDFVYRFLSEEQTNRDLEALQGLVTSMS